MRVDEQILLVNKVYNFTHSKRRHVDCLTLNTGLKEQTNFLSLDNTTACISNGKQLDTCILSIKPRKDNIQYS